MTTELTGILGGYELQRRLGRGGFCAVYLATHAEAEGRFAIKVPRSRSRGRLAREFQATHDVFHPRVVRALDLDEDGDRNLAYLVLEYVDGPDARSKLEQGDRFEPLEALRIVRSIAEALETIHARSWIHRDVTPGNILLAASGPRLADFGLAKSVAHGSEQGDALTLDGSPIGTPAYMPPEQWRDFKGMTTAGDIYSLAGCLYHFLSGRAPFGSKGPHSYEVPFPQLDAGVDVHPHVCELLHAATRHDVERRIKTARAFLDRVDECIRTVSSLTPYSRVDETQHEVPVQMTSDLLPRVASLRDLERAGPELLPMDDATHSYHVGNEHLVVLGEGEAYPLSKLKELDHRGLREASVGWEPLTGVLSIEHQFWQRIVTEQHGKAVNRVVRGGGRLEHLCGDGAVVYFFPMNRRPRFSCSLSRVEMVRLGGDATAIGVKAARLEFRRVPEGTRVPPCGETLCTLYVARRSSFD